MAAEIEKLPAVRFFPKEAALTSDHLRQMIERLEKSGMSDQEGPYVILHVLVNCIINVSLV